VLFKRRQRPPQRQQRQQQAPQRQPRPAAAPQANRSGFYRIEMDMMLKGAFQERQGRRIRQFGVTVNGATRVVTSGDVVDRETYEALVAAGAVRPPQKPPPPQPIQQAPPAGVNTPGGASGQAS
jgi:hypothetical protein